MTSQLGQDIDVLNFYNLKKNGYFIEIGANDGIELSNTYILEKNYGWKGICIEPLPDKFKELQKNRPGSICIDKAVYHTSNLNLEFLVCGLYSGIEESIEFHQHRPKFPTKINVNTCVLNDILEENQAPNFIEYLSIDTEGSEFDILKTINFLKYTFGIIHVEHNYKEEKRKKIRDFLTSNGYLLKKEIKWDDEYIHKMFCNNVL